MSDKIVVGDRYAADLISRAAPCIYDPFRDIVIHREVDGEVRGGVIFNQYRKVSMFASFAGFHPHWASRDLLFIGFDYPFRQLKVDRLFGMVKATNSKSLEVTQKLGFKPIAVIPKLYEYGIDCHLHCLEREDCRFLDVKPRRLASNEHLYEEELI